MFGQRDCLYRDSADEVYFRSSVPTRKVFENVNDFWLVSLHSMYFPVSMREEAGSYFYTHFCL